MTLEAWWSWALVSDVEVERNANTDERREDKEDFWREGMDNGAAAFDLSLKNLFKDHSQENLSSGDCWEVKNVIISVVVSVPLKMDSPHNLSIYKQCGLTVDRSWKLEIHWQHNWAFCSGLYKAMVHLRCRDLLQAHVVVGRMHFHLHISIGAVWLLSC